MITDLTVCGKTNWIGTGTFLVVSGRFARMRHIILSKLNAIRNVSKMGSRLRECWCLAPPPRQLDQPLALCSPPSRPPAPRPTTVPVHVRAASLLPDLWHVEIPPVHTSN